MKSSERVFSSAVRSFSFEIEIVNEAECLIENGIRWKLRIYV